MPAGLAPAAASPLVRAATLAALPAPWPEDLQPEIRAAADRARTRLVVLDDDPTGTQTVHQVPVLTTWGVAELVAEFAAGSPVFYVLTNTRSLPAAAVERRLSELAANLSEAARRSGVVFAVINRGDSTLRGHFPLETEVLARALELPHAVRLLIPCFEAGGRCTIGDVHWVAEGEHLVPVGATPFARDATFGFRASNLREWIAEKTGGRVPAPAVASLSLEELRQGGPAMVEARLSSLPAGSYGIVNAVTARDLEVLVLGLLRAEASGRTFLCRTAASFVAVRAGISPRPLLAAADLDLPAGGGLIVVGSHVPLTSAQLAALPEDEGRATVELGVPEVLDPVRRPEAIARARVAVEASLRAGHETVLVTSRAVVTGADGEESLRFAQGVSSALVEVVRGIDVRPRYLIAKGGITASDLATAALGIRRAEVAGQLLPGVPVWRTGPESRWPNLPFVIFPGNVGGPGALHEAVGRLAVASRARNFLLHGEPDPLPLGRTLRAGPLSVRYEQGDLRYLRLGDRELVRRIYVAVRDRNWGTVPVTLTPVDTVVGPDSFAITYDAVARQDEIDFRWRATIRGTAAGRIEFHFAGEARTAFLRNRIGFCVLHPPRECAGARCRVTLADGRELNAVFPRTVAPENPFRGFRAFAHEVTAGVWCALEFTGDEFEMEDQRNWADASFKTFCTPLDRPFPVAVAAGEQVTQQVTVQLEGAGAEVAGEAGEGGPVRLTSAGPARHRLPALGLGTTSHSGALGALELARLRALRPAHLRVDLRPGRADCRRGLREAVAAGFPLEVAVHLSTAPERELAEVAAAVTEVRPGLARWLVFHEAELSATGTRWVELARAALAGCDPVPFFTGTDHWFAQLNRARPPRTGIDGVCFSLNPQVHASDRASLVETLAMSATLVASAREFCGDLPLGVSPVTLRMRRNPAATGPERAPLPGELPAAVDPRQRSLFGAAWTLGSVKHLAEAGVASVTYYETTGWLGVMATADGSLLLARFPARPGEVFPLYHVLADLNEWAGADVVPCRASDGLRVEALLLARGDRRRLWVANLTPDRQEALCAGGFAGGGSGRLRRLTAETVADAMSAPESFRRGAGEAYSAVRGAWRFALEPFEVATLDFTP